MSAKLIGIVGWKDSGKTALVVALVSHFADRGLRVATIKHAHHNFDTDKPGTDSFRHRAAGASQVIVCSARRWVHLNEVAEDNEPRLSELIAQLTPVDLIIVEGYKREGHPKIQVMRPGHSSEAMPDDVDNIVAIATDDRESMDSSRSQTLLDLNDVAGIAQFIEKTLQLAGGSRIE